MYRQTHTYADTWLHKYIYTHIFIYLYICTNIYPFVFSSIMLLNMNFTVTIRKGSNVQSSSLQWCCAPPLRDKFFCANMTHYKQNRNTNVAVVKFIPNVRSEHQTLVSALFKTFAIFFSWEKNYFPALVTPQMSDIACCCDIWLWTVY